ncbi:MAG: PAS domain-containing protein [Chloroflexi bacterium]|nr:PAS domain-containing protein [Chloroflexota bacterium]
MSEIPYTLVVIFILLSVWFAWRYFELKKRLNQYARFIASKTDPPKTFKDFETTHAAVSSLQNAFSAERAALNAENARLATVLAQLTDGVIIADAEGRVQLANPAAHGIFGIHNATHQSVAQVVRNHRLIEAWRRGQQTRQIVVEAVEIPNRKQILQMTVIPDEHEGGSLLLAQDLTQVRKLEMVRRDFISNVSHELRTPLASLKALTETLQNGALSDPDAGPRFLDRIHTEIDALTQMTQELLDLSRIESGQVQLNFENISPRKLVYSAADRMKAQAERANLKLNVKSEDGLPNLQADKGRLEQVLVNLIHNAVKFTKPGGQICLSVEAENGGVRFAVQDTGIGIPPESLSRIFERFYRVDSSRTGSGTGLGLSISKHIVEAHGGRIWAESEEGRGSTFYFLLPH